MIKNNEKGLPFFVILSDWDFAASISLCKDAEQIDSLFIYGVTPPGGHLPAFLSPSFFVWEQRLRKDHVSGGNNMSLSASQVFLRFACDWSFPKIRRLLVTTRDPPFTNFFSPQSNFIPLYNYLQLYHEKPTKQHKNLPAPQEWMLNQSGWSWVYRVQAREGASSGRRKRSSPSFLICLWKEVRVHIWIMETPIASFMIPCQPVS